MLSGSGVQEQIQTPDGLAVKSAIPTADGNIAKIAPNPCLLEPSSIEESSGLVVCSAHDQMEMLPGALQGVAGIRQRQRKPRRALRIAV